MDHARTSGAVPGLEDPGQIIDMAIVSDNVDAVMTSFGVIKRYHERLIGNIPTILRIDGGPSAYREEWLEYTDWRLLHTLDHATALGVDGVVVMLFLGSDVEVDTLHILSQVAAEAMQTGLPVMVEALPCPHPSIPNTLDAKAMADAARIGFEHGADLLKCYYTGSPESFRTVTKNCPAPVLIAGGARMETDRDVFNVVHGSIAGGGAGVVFGRNIWQGSNPPAIVQAISALIDERASVDEALEMLG
ncbi:fructose-bisphosphate aldolase [Chloroflexi bacterium TSY]|nr:fructose-bisphosphate aldolase [Chloroflexi bacterium TSY]